MDRLLKISFIASLIGILILIIVVNSLPTRLIEIGDIDETYLGKRIAIQGTIFSITNYEDQNFQTMVIKNQSDLIHVISNSKMPINKTSDTLLITGKVETYNDELQINADKIEILS